MSLREPDVAVRLPNPPPPVTAERQTDALLQALTAIARHHGRGISAQALLAGLPADDGALTAALLVRAAANARLEAAPFQMALADIPAIVLPALLVLRSGCAVLWGLGEGEADMAFFGSDGHEDGRRVKLPLSALRDVYSGYVFFLTPIDPPADPQEPERRHWFWPVVRRFGANYTHIAIAGLLLNLISLAFPIFVMLVYDRVLPNGAIPSLVALATGVALAFIFDVIIRVVRAKMIDMTGKQIDVVLAARIFRHVMGGKLRDRPASIGSLANQIRDFDQVREFFTSASLISATDILFSAIFILVIFLIAGPLGFVPLLLVPVVILMGLIIQIPLKRAMADLQGQGAARHGILVEAIGGLETVKSLGAEGKMQSTWERSVAAAARSSERVHQLTSLAISLSNSAQQFAQLGLMVWGVFLVLNNTISVGALVAANLLIGRILSPLTNIAGMMARATQTRLALEAVDKIMKREAERPEGKLYVARTVERGSIEFRNVSFRYPGASTDALRNISFSIAAGERVGVVGRIGSGKTTLGRLLVRLYEPDEGQILIDGIDVRQYDPADLRRDVGFMVQEVQLFQGTLRQNLLVARPDASDSQIIEASRAAGVEEFVGSRPEGYDLPIAEGGRSLSGGQRQSVALARVLLRDPRILFMDEPTSALDLKSEMDFCDRIDRILGRERTFLVSTHRVSLLRFVDRLLVIEDGRLTADGPRDQVLGLMAKRGRASGLAAEPAS
jgi:ATP-binding cassette subfamily C protein LapB